MVKLWLFRGIKKGILTTKYPSKAPTQDEIPRNSAPPTPTETSDWAKGREICPTGAIEVNDAGERSKSGRIDLGRCIYCRRCSEAGFDFSNGSNGQGSLRAGFASQVTSASADALSKGYMRKGKKIFKKSFHVLMIDVGSCNACNLEVLNLSNPYYDLNRLGIFFTNSPKHADALVVVGALNKSMVDVLKRTYENIPNPKLVIAVGACPISGGIFRDTESFFSPVGDVIPVDVVIPGCPPTPIQILEGLLIAMGKQQSKVTSLSIIQSNWSNFNATMSESTGA